MIYTGIGSRKTPALILDMMTEIGMHLASNGHVLRSGGAEGADKAFEDGCKFSGGHMEIYLPIQERPSHVTEGALMLAKAVWEYRKQDIPWDGLESYTKLIMARNCLQVVGRDLETLTDAIICWTPDGANTGGTGQALGLATMINNSGDNRVVPIINLARESSRDLMLDILRGSDFITMVNTMKGFLHDKKFERNSKQSMEDEK